MASDVADGRADLWGLTLEDVLRIAPHITLGMKGEGRHFPLGTTAEKEAAYHEIYWWLRSIPEELARTVVAELAEAYSIDTRASHADLFMSWDGLRELGQDPLATIGAHTKSHFALGKLPEADMRAEIVARVERELARPCRHFSYPYGCARSAGPREFRVTKELGLLTAVNLAEGPAPPRSCAGADSLAAAVAQRRFSGHYVKALLSGIPFALMHALQRISGQQSSAA